jgi:hypothetical protein
MCAGSTHGVVQAPGTCFMSVCFTVAFAQHSLFTMAGLGGLLGAYASDEEEQQELEGECCLP